MFKEYFKDKNYAATFGDNYDLIHTLSNTEDLKWIVIAWIFSRKQFELDYND